MSKTVAQAQREYRERYRARHERMKLALGSIIAKLDGNDKPLAVAVRALAEDGLK